MTTDTVKRARLMALHERSDEMAQAVDAGRIEGLKDPDKVAAALRKFGGEMQRLASGGEDPPDLQDSKAAQWLLQQLNVLETCLACGSMTAASDMILEQAPSPA